MDDMRLKFYNPVVSGTPRTAQVQPKPETDGNRKAESENFRSILAETLRSSSEVTFSKHAVKRAVDHNIALDQDSISRLNEGVKIAEDKKLEEPLILVGNTAFVVNIPKNIVITTLDSGSLKGSAITNIDGTVII